MMMQELLQEALTIIHLAELQDEDGFDKNEERIREQYGKTGDIYIHEFVRKLLGFVDKFTSYSKRTICLGAILAASCDVK